MENNNNLDTIAKIAELVAELGWTIALPKEDTVYGVIIGTEEYVSDIILGLNAEEDFEFYQSPIGDGDLH